ncbi:putative serine/threonine protein kinase [Janibacter sp. HTCC2649]|uniref:protein kinase domain-containing protein n=1 Tax=Janibacter sp. HTCC2649 TaxID=313589 RepID=UPI0000670F62|nr:protein kinase [Janibacter sp. HTCC2649]EAP97460.1 putative serine/threonine protein kinase [Janibacter sp. HTCC2649]
MGEVFAGRYELLDPLGEGGMGTVWRVWDSREERMVAAKVLRQSDAVSLLRFVREQAFRVVHPHVLTPLGWAGEDDRVLFTMPVVEGGSVASLIGDHGPLPPRLVAEILRQLSGALDAVHAAGILHRDVKPANVLLAATGADRPHAFLTDFGIAIELDGVRLTQTGQWSGTPSYSAPESQLGAEPDPTADLYAVGQVGIAMLTGERPSASPTRPAGTPDELWRLLIELTRIDPAARPQTAGEVLRRLDVPVLEWRADAMSDVEVLRHVPEPGAGIAQLSARPDDATRVRNALVEPAPLPLLPPAQAPDSTSPATPEQLRDSAVGSNSRGPSSGIAVLLATLVVLAAVAGFVLWSPWSSDDDGSRTTDRTQSSTPSATSPTATPSASPTRQPTASPSSATPQGSVGVGTVVVTPGQPCQFSDVGVREQTVDGVAVVCQRRDNGSYAWDPPPG